MTSYNFKNRLRVTLTDVKGSRSYAVPTYFKKLVILGSISLITAVIASTLLNFYLFQNRSATAETNRVLLSRLTQVEQDYRMAKDHMKEVGQVISNLNLAETADIHQEAQLTNANLNFWDDQDTLDRVRQLASYIETTDENFRQLDTRVDSIAKFFDLEVDLSKEAQAEQDKIDEVIKLATLNARQEALLFENLPVGFPTEGKVITSEFGYRRHPLKKRRTFHRGIDLRSRIGQKLFATADGIVTKAEYNSSSGNHIVIQHNYGFETVYAHLSKLHVEPGDIVTRGDVIGLSGNTGASTAPHLHYEIRYLSKSLNPREFITLQFGKSERLTKIGDVKWDSLISLMAKRDTRQTLQLSQLEPKSQAR